MMAGAGKRERASYDKRGVELEFMKYRFCITSLKMSRFTSL
jgi:hypothetical protein